MVLKLQKLSGGNHGSEPLTSVFRLVSLRQSAGIWICGGKKTCARTLDLSLSSGYNQFFSAGQTGRMENNVNADGERRKGASHITSVGRVREEVVLKEIFLKILQS